MNDRYLFRAKRIDNGEWIIGIPTTFESFTYIMEVKNTYMCKSIYGGDCGDCVDFNMRAYRVDPSTICQCTGLKDKNGKLIWENDVVEKEFYTNYDAFANSEEYIGVVKYEDCAWVIETKRNNLTCTRPIIESMAYSDDVKHFEVIGNIFDNPELMNE